MIAGHLWADHNAGKLLYNKRVSQNNCLETFLTQGMFFSYRFSCSPKGNTNKHKSAMLEHEGFLTTFGTPAQLLISTNKSFRTMGKKFTLYF